ncbi:MAG: UDP-N-acetylmuramoyl-L-alanine--D-glutamate ligase [Deltaproteobacteria bacterium]|nr:UDP-N-acetylmuramoyl-L-alanine--D-glutamate ligase [Deltaproteobacteria bacterium]
MNLKNKKVLVVGLGISGLAVARFLKNRGAVVTVTDMAVEERLSDYARKICAMDIKLELGNHCIKTFESAELVVISPGVPHTIKPVKQAIAKGVPVIGEIELASRFIDEPVIAITGTNGKTTTTRLLGKMLEYSGIKVFVAGNIGNPLIEYVDIREKAEILVVEVSSFQLDTIDMFRPKIGVLLNIAEDHLDRYPDFAAYAASKGRLFTNQQKSDTAILNDKDSLVREVTGNINSKKVYFSDQPGVGSGLEALNISNKYFAARHNKENAHAAALAALEAGGNLDGIRTALDRFKGEPHRLEYIVTINDVMFYDDSKATNIAAVARALEFFNKPVSLIMGGRDKGGDYLTLRGAVEKHVKKLVVIGEAKEKIISALGDTVNAEQASTIEEAVSAAYKAAEPGDAVLLSPACSSFDMFKSYKERGKRFRMAARSLLNM